MGEFLTTKEIAEKLNVSVRRVRQYIENNQLKAEKFGRSNMIKKSDAEKVTIHGKAGRPKKEAAKE